MECEQCERRRRLLQHRTHHQLRSRRAVDILATERLARQSGERSQYYAAGGATHWLMTVAGECVFVDESQWVT